MQVFNKVIQRISTAPPGADADTIGLSVECCGCKKRRTFTCVKALIGMTHADFFMEPQTTWSCAHMERAQGEVMLRVRAKKEDYPTVEERIADFARVQWFSEHD